MIVWLSSYPRSGNTFLRVILKSIFSVNTYSIHDDASDIGSDKDTMKVVGHEFLPQDFDIRKKRKEKKIYCIKTHKLFDESIKDEDKVIYLIRDGRESSLSFKKYLEMFSNNNKTIIDVVCGNVVFGSWQKHVQSWGDKIRENGILIKFEELIDNPESFLDKISKIIDVDPRCKDKKLPTFNDLNKINPKFFRSGKKNSWQNEYSEVERMVFWIENYSQMIRHGYTYQIPELFNKELFEGIKVVVNNEKKKQVAIIAQKDNELQEKDLVITKKSKAVSKQVAIIAQKDNELQEKDLVITKKSKAVSKQVAIIAQKDNELQKIFNSTTWKVVNNTEKYVDRALSLFSK